MSLFKTPRVVHESAWVSKISWMRSLRLLLYHRPSLPQVPRLILSCYCTVVLVPLSTTKCPKCLSLPWCHHEVHSCGTHSNPILFYIPSSPVDVSLTRHWIQSPETLSKFPSSQTSGSLLSLSKHVSASLYFYLLGYPIGFLFLFSENMGYSCLSQKHQEHFHHRTRFFLTLWSWVVEIIL